MLSETGSSFILSVSLLESGSDAGRVWSKQQFKLPFSCTGSSKLLSRVGDFLKCSGEKPLGNVDVCLAACFRAAMGGPSPTIGEEQLTCAMLSNGCE